MNLKVNDDREVGIREIKAVVGTLLWSLRFQGYDHLDGDDFVDNILNMLDMLEDESLMVEYNNKKFNLYKILQEAEKIGLLEEEDTEQCQTVRDAFDRYRMVKRMSTGER